MLLLAVYFVPSVLGCLHVNAVHLKCDLTFSVLEICEIGSLLNRCTEKGNTVRLYSHICSDNSVFVFFFNKLHVSGLTENMLLIKIIQWSASLGYLLTVLLCFLKEFDLA